jgi:hypothetical protein
MAMAKMDLSDPERWKKSWHELDDEVIENSKCLNF